MICRDVRGGVSTRFPSNFGMYDGSLVGMTGHEWLWEIGPFLKCDKLGKSNVARKGNDI
jgi:hypothetical protein